MDTPGEPHHTYGKATKQGHEAGRATTIQQSHTDQGKRKRLPQRQTDDRNMPRRTTDARHNRQGREADAMPTCQSSTREQVEWTWTGKVFGTQVTSLIDYIATDRRTARRATRGWTRKWLAEPADHMAIGQSFSLRTWRWNEGEWSTRALPKPIGWTLDEARRKQLETTVREGADNWNHNWDVADINNFVQQLVMFGKGGKRRHQGTSTTETTIRAALATTR